MKKIRSVNPFTEEINGEFDLLTRQEVDRELEKSREAFPGWKALPVRTRMEYFKRLSAVLRKNAGQYAETITKEMGKPIRLSAQEIERSASICDFFAERSADFLEDEVVKTAFDMSYVTFEPLGVIFAIMPWNYPVIQLFRFAIPTIAAGNVVVLKSASNVPMCGKNIESMFSEAAFPEGVFKTLIIDSEMAMDMIRQDKVDGVSLTGSYAAGSQIGSLAGGGIKKVVLELGGSDPFIVLDDVNVDKVAQIAVQNRFVNNGQSCVAAKRFFVMESVAKAFTESFIHHLNTNVIGDPMDEKTDIGPLATKGAMADLKAMIDDARAKGATVIEGPQVPSKGYFMRPVVIVNTNQSMAIAREETFGPIAPIFVVKDEEEAIEFANATEFGLGATVWSSNLDRAEKIARRIDAGFVAVNRMVKSDPRLPFGGTKKSGIGRELSHYGIREFTNIKTVIIEKAD
ncbi:MAG TPA: NAD-dependent succinate-semialdehyde dehydrogenase [Syntrophorhabdaceae bacterium]|nr:NAD-dependent succinate-semialdehyde dehydrogenase [Syntrophorhabdaceae bacterium]